MEPIKSPQFQHTAVNGAQSPILESICPKCFKSLGASPHSDLLKIIEKLHDCDKAPSRRTT